MGFDLDCLAFDIAELAQTLADVIDVARQRRRMKAHEADLGRLCLLRASRERPCSGRAAEKRDEFAPPH